MTTTPYLESYQQAVAELLAKVAAPVSPPEGLAGETFAAVAR